MNILILFFAFAFTLSTIPKNGEKLEENVFPNRYCSMMLSITSIFCLGYMPHLGGFYAFATMKLQMCLDANCGRHAGVKGEESEYIECREKEFHRMVSRNRDRMTKEENYRFDFP